MAGSAFKDPEVVKLAQKFVAVLVDGDVDKELGSTYNAKGYPHSIFTDPKGKEISKVVGAVPTASFLDSMKSALKKIGPVQVKKAVKELDESAAALAKAREKNDWKGALKAVKAIEKINHEGPALAAARAAKDEATAAASKLLADAKVQVEGKKDAEARAALQKIVAEFEGLDAAVEAKTLLQKLDAASPPGGAPGK